MNRKKITSVIALFSLIAMVATAASFSRGRFSAARLSAGTFTASDAVTLSSTLAVTGASTLTGNVTAAGTLAVTGTTTLGAATSVTTGNLTVDAGDIVATLGDVVVAAGDLDLTLGDIDMPAGDINALGAFLLQLSNAGSITVTAAETNRIYVGDTFSSTGADMIFLLPTASAGLIYTFVDNDPSADSDLVITANTGDTINAGTAGKLYECVTDTLAAHSTTLLAVDATAWVVVRQSGAWVNNNS